MDDILKVHEWKEVFGYWFFNTILYAIKHRWEIGY